MGGESDTNGHVVTKKYKRCFKERSDLDFGIYS